MAQCRGKCNSLLNMACRKKVGKQIFFKLWAKNILKTKNRVNKFLQTFSQKHLEEEKTENSFSSNFKPKTFWRKALLASSSFNINLSSCENIDLYSSPLSEATNITSIVMINTLEITSTNECRWQKFHNWNINIALEHQTGRAKTEKSQWHDYVPNFIPCIRPAQNIDPFELNRRFPSAEADKSFQMCVYNAQPCNVVLIYHDAKFP